MPRKARRIQKGEYYHILTRGNNRQQLFWREKDYLFYLDALQRYQRKFKVSIFHYCLMGNHAHFLMKAEESSDGITRLMHGLQTVYAIYYQKIRKSTGHVFENRFKHFHIGTDSYLLECGRYIERNPVRAGIVTDPAHYRWSSHRYYTKGDKNEIITPNPLYLGLGPTPLLRQKEYRKYVKTARAYEILIDRYFEERILI